MLDLTPLPSSTVSPTGPDPTRIAVVLADDRAITRLIELLITRAGMPQAEVARRLGVQAQSLNQYARSRRLNPSIKWLARLASACGARVVVEWPVR